MSDFWLHQLYLGNSKWCLEAQDIHGKVTGGSLFKVLRYAKLELQRLHTQILARVCCNPSLVTGTDGDKRCHCFTARIVDERWTAVMLGAGTPPITGESCQQGPGLVTTLLSSKHRMLYWKATVNGLGLGAWCLVLALHPVQKRQTEQLQGSVLTVLACAYAGASLRPSTFPFY